MSSRLKTRIYQYELDEFYDLVWESSLKFASKSAQRAIQRELNFLKKELEKALETYVGNNSNKMHSKSKDSRTRTQYIKALVNGWLAESVAVEIILKKIFGRKRVIGRPKTHRVINYNTPDKADCTIDTKSGENYLTEVKTSLSSRGMLSPRKPKDRIFVFKCGAAAVLLRTAKKTNRKILVLWYIIPEGKYYIMGPEEFDIMVAQKPIRRKSWGKECFQFKIPEQSKWKKVEDLWKSM